MVLVEVVVYMAWHGMAWNMNMLCMEVSRSLTETVNNVLYTYMRNNHTRDVLIRETSLNSKPDYADA